MAVETIEVARPAFRKTSFQNEYLNRLCSDTLDHLNSMLDACNCDAYAGVCKREESPVFLRKGLDYSLLPKNPNPGDMASIGDKTYVYEKKDPTKRGYWTRQGDSQGVPLKPTGGDGKDDPARVRTRRQTETTTAAQKEEERIESQASEAAKKQREEDLPQFEPGRINVMLSSGETNPESVSTEDVKGLSVHEDHSKNGWVVSHSDSGLRVLGPYKEKRSASSAASYLAELSDWTQDHDEIKNSSNFDDVRNAISKLQTEPFEPPVSETTGKETPQERQKRRIKQVRETVSKALLQVPGDMTASLTYPLRDAALLLRSGDWDLSFIRRLYHTLDRSRFLPVGVEAYDLAKSLRGGDDSLSLYEELLTEGFKKAKKDPHMTKEDKHPKGGLSAKGRAKLKAAGQDIKPGVRGAADTPEKKRRKGSFLTRHYGRKDPHPLVDDKGEPTRYALQAWAWGEPVPKTVADVRKLAEKGRRLLEQYRRSKQKVKKSEVPILQKSKGAKTPALPHERISGSKKNKPGSAEGVSGKIKVNKDIETGLKRKMEEHNEKYKDASQRATLGQLKSVYRRGAGAFSQTHRPGKTRNQWAMARVNAFLKLLRSGSPDNPKYTTDNDLLPKAHKRSTRK